MAHTAIIKSFLIHTCSFLRPAESPIGMHMEACGSLIQQLLTVCYCPRPKSRFDFLFKGSMCNPGLTSQLAASSTEQRVWHSLSGTALPLRPQAPQGTRNARTDGGNTLCCGARLLHTSQEWTSIILQTEMSHSLYVQQSQRTSSALMKQGDKIFWTQTSVLFHAPHRRPQTRS